MATSNSSNFSVSRDDIIEGALRIVNGIAQGESPTADQTIEAASALNILIKSYEADGMPLWAIKQYTITLTTSSSFRIGISQTINIDKPLKIIQAFLRDINTNIDIPMRILTRYEYNLLGNKASSGTPIQIYYDPQRTYGDLFVFPTPDADAVLNKRLIIVYQRPYEDFDSSTDEPDFPQEWFQALKYGLAYTLAPEYGINPTDRKQLMADMVYFKNEALGFGTEEGSLFLQPDWRSW